MNTPFTKHKINPVSNQFNRWLPALDADYAKVDDRSYHQLLDFSVRFGSLINFYNLNDEVDGDWVDFFQADLRMVFASIESTNISDFEKKFQRLIKLGTASQSLPEKFDYLHDSVLYIVELASQFNAWSLALDKHQNFPASEILREILTDLIKNTLSDNLNKLKSYVEAAGLEEALNKPLPVDFSHFSRVWKLGKLRPDSTIYNGASDTKKINHALASLTPLLDSFIHGLGDLQHYVRSNMPGSNNFSQHRPQIALYMAFAELYRNAQNTINKFSERYVRFYYEEVLKERQLSAIPNKVFLNFVLQDDELVYSTSVPIGTLFNAGQNTNDNDIIYSADKNLLVTAATIGKLQTLTVEKGDLLQEFPEDNTQMRAAGLHHSVVQRILAREIPVDEAGKSLETWPTFGSTDEANNKAEPAILGFAVSSPYLLLTGGERIVKLELTYSREYRDQVLRPMLKDIHQVTDCSESNIFRQLLLKSFTLYASSALEWFEIQTYSINFLCAQDALITDDPESPSMPEASGDILGFSFQICFTLPASAPSIESFKAEKSEPTTGGTHYYINTSLPTLNIYLRQQLVNIKGVNGQDVNIYPISLLGPMTLDSMGIYTHVKNLENLTLVNTDGEIDQSSPFLVFGGTPVVGSYLHISHEELFTKTPSEMDVTIEWFNLPQNDMGFAGYYQYYDIGPDGNFESNLFNNTTFLGEISVVNPGSWYIGSNDVDSLVQSDFQNVYLFRTKKNSDAPCSPSPPANNKPLCANTEFAKLEIQSIIEGYPPYYNPAESALCLKLSAPSYSFGNDIYPQNVLNAVIADLPDTDECKEKCLCDCRPIADVIQCLELILENCLVISDPNARTQCIEYKLAECEITLVISFIQCFLRCLITYEKIVDPASLQNIKDKCNGLLLQPSENRLSNIKECLDTVTALKKSTVRIESCCNGSCDDIYQVAVIFYNTMKCVWQCQNTTDVLACQEASVLSALEQIQAIYNISLTACMDGCLTPDQELKYPNEPYLPQAFSVHINYRAHCTVFDINSADNKQSYFYHLLPFTGYRELDCTSNLALPMLPHYANTGNLYLGLSALTVPQILTLLFQMSGGATSDLPDVQWDLLVKNRWQNIPPVDETSDSTNGLQNSGIVALDITKINNIGNIILDNQYTWLRASVAERADDFPATKTVYPHALSASLVIADENVSDVYSVLPANTINSSVEDLADIKQINQPMTSFGGRSSENYPAFEIRMGERLRHKDRAIQTWDYERLVLQQFPDIWKVQTLPAHNAINSNAPGNVLIVVVPGSNCIDCTDPTIPAAPNDLLQNIKHFLQKRVSPFVQLHISNPVYVRIRVKVSVSFYNQETIGANLDRLNSDLVQYLSPWFYNPARATRDGDYASEADIASFILNRSYVSAMGAIEYLYEPAITDLKTDWYLLTSALQHDIKNSESINEPEISVTNFEY